MTEDERLEVIDYLSSHKDGKFFDLKKHLCKQKKFREHLPESPDQISFNLESGGRTKISALATDQLLAKAYGKGWSGLEEAKRNEIADALLIPADALQGNAVFVIDGGRVRKREVKIGIRGTRAVEVLDGLKEGERVASPASTDLKDGAHVRVPDAP